MADAIILRAVKDYRLAVSNLARNPHYEVARKTVEECEEFFRSGWFYALSELDADYLLKKLEKDKLIT